MARPGMPAKHQTTRPTASSLVEQENPLTREFTEQELIEFREAFKMFDIDGGGTIEAHELREIMEKVNRSIFDCTPGEVRLFCG